MHPHYIAIPLVVLTGFYLGGVFGSWLMIRHSDDAAYYAYTWPYFIWCLLFKIKKDKKK